MKGKKVAFCYQRTYRAERKVNQKVFKNRGSQDSVSFTLSQSFLLIKILEPFGV